jgi:signal peptidase I
MSNIASGRMTNHNLNVDALDVRVEPVAPTSSSAPADIAARLKMLRAIIRQLFACLVIAGVSFGVFQFVTHFVLQSVQIVGASMSPTLHDSERYVLNRWVYHFREPKPTDIVVLRDPSDNCYAVKRIIAKAGDSVYVKNGKLFVNGKILDEPYLPPNTPTFAGPRYKEQFWICGVNQYFVLGDNRNNSADSRVYGTVPRQNILGVVMP